MSPSPSLEGDDEYSSHEEDDMENTQEHANYPDEDTRPTSRKELAGWYSYGWAAEVFVICAMGSFLPITLEQLARDQGVLLSDRTTSCNHSPAWQGPGNSNGTIGTYFKPRPPELGACVVYLLGLEINTASFAMYTFSISVLVQSLLIISMSGAADHGHFRKTFLLVFAVIGSLATMMFIFVVPRIYVLGALLAIIANTCFGASFVLLNSFLPVLVRHHSVIQATDYKGDTRNTYTFSEDNEENERDMATSSTSLLQPDRADYTRPLERSPAAVSPELALSTKISSYGIGIGYSAGLLVQVLAILIVVATNSTTFSLRLVLFVVGAWWLLFSIPAALWLRPRPGPPLPTTLSGSSNWTTYFTYAWKSLFKTIGHARQLKDIVIFLGAWFLLSDSIATVSGTAVLFAKTNLAMKTPALALISVIATIAGVLGAFCWSYASRALNLPASRTIVGCICLMELIPLYGLLGFIPAVQRLGYLGLQQPIEMYFLGAIYGFVLGGLSSYCRSFFGELIPPGFEAAFYALYAITDKGSSIFGPAIVGLITDRYGDIRPAFVFLTVLIGLPLPLMLLVDVDRGKADAAAMAVELEGKNAHQSPPRDYGTYPSINLPTDFETAPGGALAGAKDQNQRSSHQNIEDSGNQSHNHHNESELTQQQQQQAQEQEEDFRQQHERVDDGRHGPEHEQSGNCEQCHDEHSAVGSGEQPDAHREEYREEQQVEQHEAKHEEHGEEHHQEDQRQEQREVDTRQQVHVQSHYYDDESDEGFSI